ncbi:MAG: Ig-like domain-containing protein, partial [Clostridiales bacterium]|nr:Ig-like domain-containing protein [Clostridiales bacterium]
MGETLALQAAIVPADAANKAVVWKSSNARVAKVSPTGVIAGV